MSQDCKILFKGCAVSTSKGLVVIGDFEAGTTNGYILRSTQIWPFGAQSYWSPLPVSHYRHPNPACAEAKINSEIGIVVVSGNVVEMLVHRYEKDFRGFYN